MKQLNKYIDHTLLKPTATVKEIEILCNEAKEYDFATVCVNPCQIELAAKLLKNTNVGITTVIGFPLGANTSEVKAFETMDAIKKGATEIDMVVNIGAIKDQNWDLVLNDMKAVKKAAPNNTVKVIMENCLLEKEEIVKACQLAVEAGLEFVKTSTGFSTGGATFEDVKLMADTVKDKAQVKAAGGVRTFEDAQKMIENGATRLGTSGGVSIVKGQDNTSNY
ncbi:deoxyribose-phosphate aldolase [Spiroplasma culicicola]|uniref:Deoxyribose-phosphate aldolase n=1 Tax=Spiroplasma culicicola AES-1 TaxID=1276246 RepID=W6A789_9MOLU|nr:deoxyribose-phosphate aldolase [Spiroplasma culicicola]AHI52862.1 deoxyribose-phosphate aldolase [Spiroplasma culicicola AES-1]